MDGSRVGLTRYVYETDDVREAYEAIFGPLPPVDSIDPFPGEGRPSDDPRSVRELELNEAWNSMTSDGRDTVNRIASNVMKCVAAYERQLVSLDSPFDAWIDQIRSAPDEPSKWTAISASAQEGARLFVDSAACDECHSGPMLMDNDFHNAGLPARDWLPIDDDGRASGIERWRSDVFNAAGPYSDDPNGQMAELVSKLPQQRQDVGAFRTPTLRNLSKTAPYMHGGHFEDIEEVLEFYNDPEENESVGIRAKEIRPLRMSDDQIAHLQAFLETLEGAPISDELTRAPESPFPVTDDSN